jgi:uncharacterized protein YndB with AHSA1/START domain
MTPKISPAGEAAAREIVITRVFDAPRELVWRARTESEGVRQGRVPAQMDARAGGSP